MTAPEDNPVLVPYRVGILEGKVDAHNEHLQRLGDATRDLASSTAQITVQLNEWKARAAQEEKDRIARQDRAKNNIAWWIGIATTVTSVVQTVIAHTVLK